MVDKSTQVTFGLSLLLLSPLILSAQELKMHVFEQKEQNEKVTRSVQVPQLEMHIFDYKESPEVTSKSTQVPQLEMHVFDTSPTLQNNAVVAERYTRQKPAGEDKLLFPYTKSESYINMGYRRDNLDWSIAGSTGTPNILSELKWKDIEIATISAGTTLFFESDWLINFDFLYGRVYDGANQDSDYLGDNRTLEFSRSNNNSDKGSVLDLSASVGYNWLIPFSKHSTYPNIEFRPLVGLSYYSQNLKITDGNQTISVPIPELGITLPPIGPFAGLDTSYDATWFGPWLGLKSIVNFTESFSLSASLEYHYAKYDGTANWNLRSDFAHPESFTDEADGYGLIGDIEGQFRLSPQLSLSFTVSYQDWQADEQGVHTTFFSDGRISTTKYNGVNWQSLGANIGVVYHF